MCFVTSTRQDMNAVDSTCTSLAGVDDRTSLAGHLASLLGRGDGKVESLSGNRQGEKRSETHLGAEGVGSSCEEVQRW